MRNLARAVEVPTRAARLVRWHEQRREIRGSLACCQLQNRIFQPIGSGGRPEVAPRLLELLDDIRLRSKALPAAATGVDLPVLRKWQSDPRFIDGTHKNPVNPQARTS